MSQSLTCQSLLISAAHCVIIGGVLTNVQDIKIIAGVTNLKIINIEHSQIRQVSKNSLVQIHYFN